MPSPAPFFSIILPTFNRAHLLPRAIKSILKQECADWELIVIDDGSTDNSAKVVAPYLADPRIRLHHYQNGGPAIARNRGIALSSGTYITFLDSDDEYLPHHLQLRKELLETSMIDLLHGGLEIIGDAYVADMFDNSKRIHIAECFAGGTFFIKRELAEALEGFRDLPYGDDSDFARRAVEYGAKVVKVDWTTYRYYRDQPDSLCAIAERSGEAGILAYRNSSLSPDVKDHN